MYDFEFALTFVVIYLYNYCKESFNEAVLADHVCGSCCMIIVN